jgi:predicted nucleic acid-binding protein
MVWFMATKAIIFDSNVWIGYFNVSDTTHKQAVAVFEKHSGQTIILTEYILLEVATVLKQQIGPTTTNKIISALLQTDTIQVLESAAYFQLTLQQFLTTKEKYLSFVDTSLVTLAGDFTIVTFDRKLATAIKE